MDLDTLNVVAGAGVGFDLQLCHPGNGANLPIFIHILGSDSREYKRVESEQNRKRIEKLWKGGVFRPAAQSAEEAEEDVVARLVAVTQAWWEVLPDGAKQPTLEVKGEQIAFSSAAAAKIYTENPWIKEQVYSAVVDRANFING